MTNTNCLNGIRCPLCGQEDAFRIEATITVYVTDDGTDDERGCHDWNGESYCQCVECHHEGMIKDFRIENQSAKQAEPDAADPLTAAAPLLLETLEFIATDIEEGVKANAAWLKIARDAIAKAKGGAA